MTNPCPRSPGGWDDAAPQQFTLTVLVQAAPGYCGIYSLAVDDLDDDLHSVFVDWPPGVSIDEPEVRFASQLDGQSSSWEEVERIPHPTGEDRLIASIEVVFRRMA